MELIVHGKRVAVAPDDAFAQLYGADFESYQQLGEIKIAGVRAGEARPLALDGDGADVIEVEDADGVISFHRADQLARDANGTDITDYLESTTRARGTGAGLSAVRRVQATLPPGIAEKMHRVDQAVRADIDRSGTIGGENGAPAEPQFTRTMHQTMHEVVKWIDNPVAVDAPDKIWHSRPKPPGVYLVGENLKLSRDGLLKAGARSGKPYLVLLHGTFSHTEAAFGALRASPEWRQLVAKYEDRILAVEHPTLGRTPAQNALQAAQSLPDGAVLHLLSHSRGGLVGEALSYAAATEPDLKAYDGVEHPDTKALPELHALLTEREITVDRFVRVACPARGTALASHRLDRWAAFLFNVFNLVPGLRDNGTAALVKKFLVTVLDQRTDPRLVPGIEAQLPESPFLRMLMSAEPLADNLGSVAGDVRGSGIARRLLVMGTDLFFGEDHDFVVPTSSMSGGVPRTTRSTASFAGADVSHGAYFSNVDSRRAVLDWLGAKPGHRVEAFAEPEQKPTRSPQRDGALPADREARDVLVVPDLLGSRLTVDGAVTWPDVGALVRRGLCESLAGTPAGLVDAYQPLLTTLDTRYQVARFEYAPAEPVAGLAERLAAEICAGFPVGKAPHLVAHGLGALLVLEALRTGDLAGRWRASGGRAVLLGPPLQGSWLVEARDKGRDEFTAALALLAGCTPAEIGTRLACWPVASLLRPGTPRATVGWAGISAVYGSAELTAAGKDKDEFTCSAGGDGFAMHSREPGLPMWHAVVPHADLPADLDVAHGVLELLAGGTPSKLLSSPPAATGGDRPLPDPRGQLLLPTATEIVRMAWGGGSRTSTRQVLKVSVVHGDLGPVAGPVLVGHQDGTPISGAETALNERLAGALTRRLDMRQYPGPLGTCETFGNKRGPQGVVIGVGDAGDLTPRGLTAGVIQAVLRLVAEHRDRGETDPLAISAVLIGTTLVPAMPVENSLTAIVTGVRQANRKLRDLRSPVFVDELRIVELYEDRAIQAARAAIDLARTLGGDGGTDVVVEGRLGEGEGARRGMPRPDYHDDTWRTVRIVAADPGRRVRVADGLVELSFTSIGRDAGAQQRVNTSQRRLLDELVAEAMDKPEVDDQLFNTLYEMLVPNALKEQGYGSEHLSVVVDEQAGVLPLEMLASRTQDEGVLPLAVQVGVLRRLELRTATEGTRPSSGRAALVIGDPAGTGLVRLPAARAEAERVRDRLRRMGYEVTAIIPGPNADEDVVGILNALFAREYRILHIAGHGNYDPVDVTRSGVRIGRDAYLGPLEIAKMRTTPDLVFANCCHLGAMRPRTLNAKPLAADRFASSVSRQLVENGVRAVIAAGWAVDDQAACMFAETLFDQLLSGHDLGLAALAARKKVHKEFPWTNTWGAYQIYGPPAFRLEPVRPPAAKPAAPVARRELIDRLDDLRRCAENCRSDEGAPLVRELRDLLDQVPKSWLTGQELSAAGEVAGLLGVYDMAMEHYRVVCNEWASAGTLKAIEQLVNMQAKQAVRLVGRDAAAAAGLLAEAEELANALLQLGPTPERKSLLGSVAARRARCVADHEANLVAALTAARNAYQQAVGLCPVRTGEAFFYPALNKVVFELLVHLRTGAAFDTAAADELITASCAAAGPADTFWSKVTGGGDVPLARALVHDELAARRDEITAAYEKAFAESSIRDRAAVVEHLEIIAIALPANRAPDKAMLLEMYERLRDADGPY
jgi:CHAT domain-containing protein